MSMARIREQYEVPAKRGMAIVYDSVPVVIVGSRPGGLYLAVRRTDVPNPRTFYIHPTWMVEYPKQEPQGHAPGGDAA